MARRFARLEESVARYLSQLDTADRQEPTEALAAKVTRLTEKLTKLKEEMGKLTVYASQWLSLANGMQRRALARRRAIAAAPSCTQPWRAGSGYESCIRAATQRIQTHRKKAGADVWMSRGWADPMFDVCAF